MIFLVILLLQAAWLVPTYRGVEFRPVVVAVIGVPPVGRVMACYS